MMIYMLDMYMVGTVTLPHKEIGIPYVVRVSISIKVKVKVSIYFSISGSVRVTH